MNGRHRSIGSLIERRPILEDRFLDIYTEFLEQHGEGLHHVKEWVSLSGAPGK
jgi:hypothetical protein